MEVLASLMNTAVSTNVTMAAALAAIVEQAASTACRQVVAPTGKIIVIRPVLVPLVVAVTEDECPLLVTHEKCRFWKGNAEEVVQQEEVVEVANATDYIIVKARTWHYRRGEFAVFHFLIFFPKITLFSPMIPPLYFVRFQTMPPSFISEAI